MDPCSIHQALIPFDWKRPVCPESYNQGRLMFLNAKFKGIFFFNFHIGLKSAAISLTFTDHKNSGVVRMSPHDRSWKMKTVISSSPCLLFSKVRHICQLILGPHFSGIAPQGRNTFFTLRFARVSERLVNSFIHPTLQRDCGAESKT